MTAGAFLSQAGRLAKRLFRPPFLSAAACIGTAHFTGFPDSSLLGTIVMNQNADDQNGQYSQENTAEQMPHVEGYDLLGESGVWDSVSMAAELSAPELMVPLEEPVSNSSGIGPARPAFAL